jgi:hypothetical protein
MPLDVRTLFWLIWGRNPERKKPRRCERHGPTRDRRYLDWIRTLPCAACGSRYRIEAAHTGSDGGMSQKPSDHSCVPLCGDCHTAGRSAYHRIGKQEFERRNCLNLAALVRLLNRAWEQNRLS